MSTTSHVGPSRTIALEPLRAVLDSSPIPTAILQWGRLLFLNKTARTLLGKDEAEKVFLDRILGLPVGAPEDEIMQRIGSLKERMEPVEVARKRWVRRSGRWIRQEPKPLLVEVQAWTIPLEGGGGSQLTFRDVTERDQTEGAQRRAEGDLRLAIESSQIGVFEFNSETGRIRCSKCVRGLLQMLSESEIDYPAFLQRVDPEDRLRVDLAVQQSLDPRGSGAFGVDYRILRPDGGICWVAAKGHAFLSETADGRKVGRLIGTMLDVTALRQMDSSFLQKEKLVATGRLAASLAHEINNPLEAMTNLLYLLEGSPLHAEQRRYLVLARQELTRVIDIANDSLRFYRDPGTPTQCKVPGILDSVLAHFATRIEASHIRVERRDSRQASVFGSCGELRQVFINLVHNAVDAMPKGGRLLMRTAAATEWTTGRKGVRITIADTGQGMNRDTMKRLFEPFFTTRTTTGIGLGLWLCAEIVDSHGGSVRVKSRQSGPSPPQAGGTVFSVFLPLDRRK